MELQHTCADEAAIALQAICEDGSVGTSDIFILVAAVAILVALGWVVWNWSRRRFQG